MLGGGERSNFDGADAIGARCEEKTKSVVLGDLELRRRNLEEPPFR
jgi:hypothetical protein